MTDTALRGEQRQMIDTEQVCQLGSGSGSVSGLHCEGQNQLAQILAAIVDGQLQAAYDAVIDWYIGSFLQSTSPSNGLLNKESFNPQFLHAEKSSKTLVYMLTAFVRSANNELTSPVEDALISSLLAVSVGNLDVARSVIKPGLDAEVLNPATQDEFQWIIDAFDAGFTEDAVTRIISLLAGCPTSEARLTQAYASIYIQLLEVYDQITKESAYGKDAFLAFWKRIQNGEPPVSEEDMKLFTDLAYEYEEGGSVDAAVLVMEFLTIPCENIFDISFSNGIFNLISTMKLGYFESSLAEFNGLLTDNRFANNPTYDEVLSQLKAALDKVNNSDYDGALEEMRKILVTCICKSEVTEE